MPRLVLIQPKSDASYCLMFGRSELQFGSLPSTTVKPACLADAEISWILLRPDRVGRGVQEPDLRVGHAGLGQQRLGARDVDRVVGGHAVGWRPCAA